MDVISWTFVIVFGIAFVISVALGIGDYMHGRNDDLEEVQ